MEWGQGRHYQGARPDYEGVTVHTDSGAGWNEYAASTQEEVSCRSSLALYPAAMWKRREGIRLQEV